MDTENEEFFEDYGEYVNDDVVAERDYLEKTIEKAKARLKELTDEEMSNTEGGWTYKKSICIYSPRRTYIL